MRLGLFSMALTIGLLSAVGAMAKSAPNAKTQKAAILACKNALGVGGPFQTTTSWQSKSPFGGHSVVLIKPYAQVTPGLADQINACAARALGGAAPAPAGQITDASTYVAAEPAFNKYASNRVQRTGRTQEQPSVGCVMGYGVMQRGTLYCPGH